MNDMVISGNGPLPIVLHRKYESIPKAYPYAFGNMSLVVPHIRIDVQTDAAHDTSLEALPLLCGTWRQQPGVNNQVTNGASWSDIKFYHQGGMVSLVDRDYLQSNALANYPDEAVYISKDNWYLRCSGADNNGGAFQVHSPDGLVYTLGIGERTAHKRDHAKGVKHYSEYSAFVTKIQRLSSVLTYNYEPDPSVGDQAKIFPPRFIGKYEPGRALIRGKSRLKSIVASNTEGNDNRSVTIDYFPTDSGYANWACPNRIQKIASNFATNTSVSYRYERNTNSVTNPVYPIDQCLLNRATMADGSYWEFEYGDQTGTPHQFVVAGKEAAGDYSGFYNQNVYFPLRSVTVPTGAKVTYEYVNLGTCQYQDVYEDNRNTDFVNHTSCPDDGGQPRGPAMTRRTVADTHAPASFQPIEQSIGYSKPDSNPENEVVRVIDNPERRHVLTFGRIDRFEPATSSTEDSGRRLHSGRLLRHEVRDKTAESRLFAATDYQYAENKNFLDYARVSAEYPASNSDNFRLESGRFKFAYDALRINRQITTTVMNGNVFETHSRSFNQHNLPTRIDEKFNGKSRTTAINYVDTHPKVWAIGKVAYSGTGKTAGNEPSGDLSTTHKSYTQNALIMVENAQGFSTNYEYHPWGDVKKITDGKGNITKFNNYKNGVAQRTIPATGGSDWAYTFDDGTVYKTVDTEGHVNEYRYNTMGELTNQWRGVDRSDEMRTAPPNWHNKEDPHYRRKQEWQHNFFLQRTSYDALGRPTLIHKLNYINGPGNIWQAFAYDVMGRQTFASDPQTSHINGIANWPGTTTSYDAFDRPISKRHTSGTGNLDYCYGPDCNNTQFAVPGASISHGYVVKDQGDNLTAYNHEAYGHPSKQQVVDIYQQVKGDNVVTTHLERNVHGFVTSVSQGGKTRTYTPYKHAGVNGSLTSLIASETHPEFSGPQVVNNYDGAGNPTSITTYRGDTLSYSYTKRNQLRGVSSSDGSYSANYTYLQNGLIKTASAGGSTWSYEYLPDEPLLKQEKLDIDGRSFTVDYQYGPQSQLTRMEYPDGLVINPLQNGFGQTASMTFNSGAGNKPLLLGATYHANGQLHTATLSNGQAFTSSQNNRQLPENWGSNKAGTLSDTLGLRYQYDGRNNVTQVDNYFSPHSSNLFGLTYDGLNRLTEAKGHWGTANYVYDNLSNITYTSFDGPYGYDLNYQYGVNNRLLAVLSTDDNNAPSRNFGYDGNGNVTANGLTDFTYDAVNQLLSATSVGKVLSSTYDANHHRSKAVVTSEDRTRTTYSLYSAGSLLYEHDAETGEQRSHIFLAGQSIATLGTHDKVDSDGDGIPDYYERLHGLNAHDAGDRNSDADQDRVSNFDEYLHGGIAMSTDGDNDGLPDAWERAYLLDLSVTASATTDTDNDEVPDRIEYHNGTNPLDPQSKYPGQIYLVPVIQQLFY